MTKKFCKKCGNALNKTGAKFCATCGASVDGVDTDDISNQETTALPGEKTNQIVPATEVIPAITPVTDQIVPATEVIPAIRADQTVPATEVIPAITPTSYETDEMPRPVIRAQAEGMATEVIEAIAPKPVAQTPIKQAEPAQEKNPPVQQAEAKPKEKEKSKKKGKSKEKEKEKSKGQSTGQSGGPKKLALAVTLGVMAIAAVAVGAYLFINSRATPEAQEGTQTANNAGAPTAPQTVATQPVQQASPQASPQLDPPSGAVANNQSQSQTRPQPSPSIGNIKSPVVQNDPAASKTQQQAAAKPTPAAPKLTAEDHKNLGNTYVNSGRYQEALQEYESMKRLDPGNKDVYYLMGLAYSKLNQPDKALESFRQCTSGTYVQVAQKAVKNLEKIVGKLKAK